MLVKVFALATAPIAGRSRIGGDDGDRRPAGARQGLARDDPEGAPTPEVRLPGERELASTLGASRTSVREVLSMLEALRVIERRPQSGIYVRAGASDVSIEALVLEEDVDLRAKTISYEHAQEARVIHEVEAARLAAKRRTQADLVAMRAAIEVATQPGRGQQPCRRGRGVPSRPDCGGEERHPAAGCQVALLMTRSVRQAYFEATGFAATSIEEHEALLDSVERREAELASTLMRKHYAGSSARWRKAFARN